MKRGVPLRLLVGLTPALFLVACGAGQAEPGGSKPDAETLASVPLELTRRGAVVQANVNGKGPFGLILDSGSEVAFLSHEILGPLGDGVEVIRSAEGVYDRAAWEKSRIHVSSITFGDLTLRDASAVVVDLGVLFGDKEPPAGLLALGVFSDYLVTIDYPGERFLIRKGALPPANHDDVLQYTEEEVKDNSRKYPAIQLHVAEHVLRARLDVATGGGIMLPTALMETLPLAGEPGRMAMARTPDGDFDILGTVLDGAAKIGAHSLERPKLRFSELYDDASLGTDLLDQFVLTFDQVNRRVRFERPADYRDPLHEEAAHVRPITGDGDDLRTAFNKNAAKVQLLMILSPT